MNWTASHLASKKKFLGDVQNGRFLKVETGWDKGDKQRDYFGQGHFPLGDKKFLLGELTSLW